ncbi:hypothetical protein U5817_09950 [Aromatoleum evansii]|uniref:Uncharacterized protein n=1 Tax=Aromatoleum evansii TaxID=59406 RepID=A0ABZ1ASR4_AROEV|nr:hypothetical protein U5817_09600 [Aromatoleum evansii]WRL48349.1 hypothetical protein U5817_09950 [Aromatoleum evansii]
MAGVKGRSGGARPGAGRKPKKRVDGDVASTKQKKPVPIQQGEKDMLELLQDIALGKTEATSLQVRAAIAAVQYTHTKRHDGGKKDEQAEKAKKAAGKFASALPPKLVVNNR